MSILSRMNISKENEKIILLEDYETFDMFLIKEISNIKDNYSDINLFLKMEVLYDEMFERNNKTCRIIDLKNNFDFIKILNRKNEKVYFINFLILKNNNYTCDDILEKINKKIIFGNYIKDNMNLEKFPIDNDEYICVEENINNYKKYNFYDKVYSLIQNNEILERTGRMNL